MKLQALLVTDRSPALRLPPQLPAFACNQLNSQGTRDIFRVRKGQVGGCSKQWQWCAVLQSARAVGPTGPHDLPAAGLISDASATRRCTFSPCCSVDRGPLPCPAVQYVRCPPPSGLSRRHFLARCTRCRRSTTDPRQRWRSEKCSQGKYLDALGVPSLWSGTESYDMKNKR